MNGKTSFLDEIKRRNVLRMAGLYLVAAWLVTQVAGTLLPMFGAPPWIARAGVIVLAIGCCRRCCSPGCSNSRGVA